MFSIDQIKRKISSLKRLELGKPSIETGKSDVPITYIFKNSNRHLDVTAQDLSERWRISISATVNKLNKTTHNFLRSSVLPLSRRYITDRLFTRKTFRGDCLTDTMHTKFKSLEVNKYVEVFANKASFFRIHPMD